MKFLGHHKHFIAVLIIALAALYYRKKIASIIAGVKSLQQSLPKWLIPISNTFFYDIMFNADIKVNLYNKLIILNLLIINQKLNGR